MGWFQKIVGFFFVPKTKEPEPLLLPAESMALLEKVENQNIKDLTAKITDLEVRIGFLTMGINALIKNHRNQEEMLVAIATLHEELLNNLDQGKVVMVKQQQPKLEEPPQNPNKGKKDNWN
jgi:hypothetical protein